jgi:hypothetical protein
MSHVCILAVTTASDTRLTHQSSCVLQHHRVCPGRFESCKGGSSIPFCHIMHSRERSSTGHATTSSLQCCMCVTANNPLQYQRGRHWIPINTNVAQHALTVSTASCRCWCRYCGSGCSSRQSVPCFCARSAVSASRTELLL